MIIIYINSIYLLISVISPHTHTHTHICLCVEGRDPDLRYFGVIVNYVNYGSRTKDL